MQSECGKLYQTRYRRIGNYPRSLHIVHVEHPLHDVYPEKMETKIDKGSN